MNLEKFRMKKILILSGLSALLILIMGTGLTLGPYSISLSESYKAVLQYISGKNLGVDTVAEQVVIKLRTPRILWAVAAGMSFGLTGALMQTVLRNPLASPFTLGISAGANLGVSIAIILGIDFTSNVYGVIGNAFLFAMFASLLIMALASLKGSTVQTLVLAGIALNYALRAFADLLEYMATPEQLEAARAYSRGELGAFGYRELVPVSVTMLAAAFLIIPRLMDLDAMVLGDERAKSLGVKVPSLRIYFLLISSILVAGVVAFAGPIGFVGLAGPHIARSLTGTDHKVFLPASALLGAIVLLCADLAGTNLLDNVTIPVGVMTSMIGVPFFLYFIFRERRNFW